MLYWLEEVSCVARGEYMIGLEDKWDIQTGRVLLSGTQAIARVLLTQRWLDKRAGLRSAGYVTGYRGSPLGAVDSTLWSIAKRLEDADIRFQPGLNEDIAATAVAGSQQIDQLPDPLFEGVFAAWYGKGPGVDRSGDALRHGNYAGAHAKGGVLLFYGDDHAGKSSTVAYQSEQTVTASMIPVLYPADVAEIVTFGLLGYALSRHSGSWVAMKCVNEVVEQTATIDIDVAGFHADLPPHATVPPEGLHAAVRPFNPLRAEQIVVEHRLPLVTPFVRANRIDRAIFRSAAPRLAIVSAGKSYGDVLQALHLLGLDETAAALAGISLYKVGCIWPLDGESVAAFGGGHETLLVIEEKKAFLEHQLASAMVNDRAAPRLIGKRDEDGIALLSEVLLLEPCDIAIVIAGRLERLGVAHPALRARAVGLSARVASPQANLISKRSPFFCSGCPHNRSTRVPAGSLSMTGIGCHTMANFVRPEEALLPAQMGGEGGNWIGLAPFTGTPHIFQNMGDGTYYHSGLLAIRAAVAAGVNITYKILYNDAVAMTGGQPVDGPLSVAEIAHQVRHEGVHRIVIVSDDPQRHERAGGLPLDVSVGHRDELDRFQRALRETAGCSVLIYEQTCAAEKRRRRKRGTFPDPAKRLVIADSVCEGCGDCSVQSTCVSIVPHETALGTKRAIDQSSCNKDYSCNQGFCPSFITVRGAEPKRAVATSLGEDILGDLPLPAVVEGDCNLMVAGIGGTGVITVGALIGMAAHIDGRSASLFDMTGLAQKNGAVFSHVRIGASSDRLRTQRLGRGEADLLLAFDMVAALSPEAANTLAAGRTRAIVNDEVMPTLAFQFDRDFRQEPEILLGRLGQAIGTDAVTHLGATTLAQRLTGDTIGANLLLVGLAAQHGLLPVSVAAIEQAIKLNGVAVRFNLDAFRLGRLAVVDPERLAAMAVDQQPEPELPETLQEIVAHRSAHLTAYQDRSLAARYLERIAYVAAVEQRVVPGSERLAATVARNLAKLYAIKDEYEVARLLSEAGMLARIDRSFGAKARLSFNLAPPMFAGWDAQGRPRKREYPAWAMLPLFRMLRGLRRLRGTVLNPFGYSEERRMERALARDYEALVERTLDGLTAGRIDAAVHVLDLVDQVRGFGPVKASAAAAYRAGVARAEQAYGRGAMPAPVA
jgi:indolepyruvate ferredoxin oxidoreductase